MGKGKEHDNAMLMIKNIRKQYVTGDLTQTALDDVSLNFRDNEFVAVLGPSGSGKTTLLNVVGGLDRYDSGDLIINGISTKKYKDRDWDSYRNHTIGFVFQSYNLIPHQTVLANVELALTISGVSKSERRKRAKEALEKVGLGDQLHKRPNQMSGGQMQRVAIARALVNDPDILLADEPTGALDSETSVQVMELLNEVADDRLVIMVTHNPELAEKYATRIVKLSDGKIIDDSDPYVVKEDDQKQPEHKNMGKASMSLATSLSLSFNNLRTKKGRTILTSFAGSIGIIGIALIQSLSAGVNIYISDVQRDTMSSYPVTVDAQTVDLNSMMEITGIGHANEEASHPFDGVYSSSKTLQAIAEMSSSITENNLTSFKKYLDDKDSEIHQYIGSNGIVYSYKTDFKVYTYDDNQFLVNTDGSTLLDEETSRTQLGMMTAYGNDITSTRGGTMGTNLISVYEQLIPDADGTGISPAITDNYDIVYGHMPKDYNELVLVLDKNNEVQIHMLYKLGILPTAEYREICKNIYNNKKFEIEDKKLDYEAICNKEFFLMPAADFYLKNADGTYENISENNLKIEQQFEHCPKLKISGVMKPKEGNDSRLILAPIGYTKALTDYLIRYADDSEVVKDQKEHPDLNVVTGLAFTPKTDEEKAADAKKYIYSLNKDEKAALFSTTFSSMSSDFQQLFISAMQPQTGSSSQSSGSQSSGSVTTTQIASIASMTDEEISALMDQFIEQMDPVILQEILTGVYDKYISTGSYDENLKQMGVVSVDAPNSIALYADSFENKEKIETCIENYNKTVDEEDKITYTDYVALLMSSVTTIINVISYILMAFVAVSLIVSSIMIGIITYISVLERTKEIGILRAIGASKRNISRVFNAETFIIGLFSGFIGICITLVLLLPINAVIHALSGMDNINAVLPVQNAVILIALSVLLTLIGGIIPSKKAAKKDPVAALRTE